MKQAPEKVILWDGNTAGRAVKSIKKYFLDQDRSG
jgi:hypothetical protein